MQAGALYWHFASKQALLDTMADRFIEGIATIEEQAQTELAERGAWEPKLAVDGIENKLAATAFTADPAERFGYGLQLVIDGIRQQLAPLPSAAQAADQAGSVRLARPDTAAALIAVKLTQPT